MVMAACSLFVLVLLEDVAVPLKEDFFCTTVKSEFSLYSL